MCIYIYIDWLNTAAAPCSSNPISAVLEEISEAALQAKLFCKEVPGKMYYHQEPQRQ